MNLHVSLSNLHHRHQVSVDELEPPSPSWSTITGADRFDLQSSYNLLRHCSTRMQGSHFHPKSLHEEVQHLTKVRTAMEAVTCSQISSNIYDVGTTESYQGVGFEAEEMNREVTDSCQINSSFHVAVGNGLSQTASCEAETSGYDVEKSGVDGTISQEVSTIFTHRLPSNLSFFQKTTNGELALTTPPRTELKRPYQTSEKSSPRKKRGIDFFSLSQHVITKEKQRKEQILKVENELSLETPKHQKNRTDFVIKGPLNVRKLLKTGFLEGAPVKYMKDKAELDGFIKDQGYQCGCSSCNFTVVVSALKFESHAGAASKNQNNHIYLKSGISLYALVKKLGNNPLDSLPELVEESIGSPVNNDRFEDCQASLKTTSINIEEVNENDEENHWLETTELHCDAHLVSSAGPATKGSFDEPSCVDLSSPEHDMGSNGNPASGVKASFISSATEHIKQGSDILVHSSSIMSKSSLLKSRNKWKRLPDSVTDGNVVAPSSLNVMFNSPRPHIEGSIIPSCIDVNVSSLESAKDSSIDPGSNISIHETPVTQKCYMMEIKSERRKRSLSPSMCMVSRPATSSDPLESDVRLVERMGVAHGGHKKRTNDLHRIIFMGNTLEDGAELFYLSNGKEVLKGYKKENGILCSHCGEVVSPSKFEAHAGFPSKRQPYRGIFTSDGISLHELTMSLSNCQNLTSTCMICGGGGELVSCNGCTETFHAGCLELPNIPDADSEWQCFFCRDKFGSERASRMRSSHAAKPINLGLKRVLVHPKDGSCTLCDDSAFEMGKEFGSKSFIFCGQCEKLYHVDCLRNNGICDLKERPLPWFSWLCSIDCKEVHKDLRHLVLTSPHDINASTLSILKKSEVRGLTSEVEPKMKWQLLCGTHKTCANESLFLKATTIFQEAFGPILENGYDLIPAMVEGQELSKQHYGGMYCAVITTNSEVVSAGLLRVFGRDVAELPLVATPKECQAKGYFQALLSIVEQLLIRLKVKFLVLPVDEDAESIWINKFGFVKMTEERVKQYAEDHWILMFKKKTMLEKALLQSEVNRIVNIV